MTRAENRVCPIGADPVKIAASRGTYRELARVLKDPVLSWTDTVTTHDYPITAERAEEIRSQIRVGEYSDERRRAYLTHEKIGYFRVQPLDAYFISPVPRRYVEEGLDESMDIVVPVGHYGPDIAYAITATSVLFRDRLVASMTEMVDAVDIEHGKLLRIETFRGSKNNKATCNVLGDATLTMGVMGLLFAERLKGFPTDRELLEAIIAQDYLTKVAKLSPNGVVGPLLLSGSYIEGMVQERDGVLEMEWDIAAKLSEIRREHVPLGIPQDRSWGCPGAYKPSSNEDPWLTTFTRVYAEGVKDFLARGTPADLRSEIDHILDR